MTPGTWTAKILDYGLKESKAGKTQAFVKFECPDISAKESNTVYWYGSLDMTERQSKKGNPYTILSWTISTLRKLGAVGATDLDVLQSLKTETGLPMGEVVKIVVEDFVTSDGKHIPTVRQILFEDGSTTQEGEKSKAKMTPEEIDKYLSATFGKIPAKKTVNATSSIDEDITF